MSLSPDKNEERKRNLMRFYNFIEKNKDKYPLSQICSLYAFNTGIHMNTVKYYVKILTGSKIMTVENDKVVKLIDIHHNPAHLA